MVPRRTIIAERVLADAGLFDRVRMEECVCPSVPEQYPAVLASTPSNPKQYRRAPVR